MGTPVTFNGVSYTVPSIADASWGTNVSNYLIAIASGCLQKTGGSFTLSQADIDFGGTYGLKSVYFKSKTANIAAAGVLILAVTDTINWRNNANSADLSLGVNGSDQLIFKSIAIADISSSQTLTNKNLSDSTVNFVNVLDATKIFSISLGSATTGTNTTFSFAQTANRTITVPDISDTLVMLTATQALTNKDFQGGTASNTSRLTMPGATTTTLSGLTRKAGTIVYDTTLGAMQYDDGSILHTLATSSAASPTAAGIVTSFVPVIMSSVDTVTNANYAAGNTDGYSTILMSTGSVNRTVTLPAPASNTGRSFVIKKIDSGSGIVTINPNVSETIDGQSAAFLNGQYAYVSLTTDGTNWFVKDGFNISPVGTLGTITFQGGTAPTTQTMANYRWSQVGNMVTISWFFAYSSVGSGVSSYYFTMPSDVPTPLNWPSATTNPNAGATSTFSGTSTILGVALTDFNDAVPSGWAILVEHASGTGISTARGSVTFPTAIIV